MKGVKRKKLVAEVPVQLDGLLHKQGNVIDGVWYDMEKVVKRKGRYRKISETSSRWSSVSSIISSVSSRRSSVASRKMSVGSRKLSVS